MNYLTAHEAKEQVELELSKIVEAQLIMVIEEVNKAIKNIEYSTMIFNNLNQVTIERLIKLGYKIEKLQNAPSYKSFNEGDIEYQISWF